MGSPEVMIPEGAVKAVWLDPDNLNLRGRRKNHLRTLTGMLEKRQGVSRAVAECLLGKDVPVPEPAVGMRSLVAEIHAESPKESGDAILAVLGRVVHYWNFAHTAQNISPSSADSTVEVTSLPLPEIPVRMPRPLPPFTPERWAGLERYKDWADAVLEDIVHSASQAGWPKANHWGAADTQPDISFRIARVLASAVLWGGLLCMKHLEEFYSSLSCWTEISECAGGRVYMTWFDEAKNCRRWMPDAITASLMIQLQPTEFAQVAAVTAKDSIERIMSKYFRSIMTDAAWSFRLSEFIDASLLHHELRLPRCLTEYAAGRLPSASPNRSTWARMTRSQTIETENEPTDEPDWDHAGSSDEDKLPGSPENKANDWVSGLRLLLGSADPKRTPSRALQKIDQHLESFERGGQEKLFFEFAAAMLAEHRRHKLKTIRNLVLGVATRVPVAVELDKPESILPDTLSSAYSFILDDAVSPSHYNKLRRYLREFHRWLEQTDRCATIDYAEVFGSAKQAQAVDARLILEDEYLAARDSLVDWSKNFADDSTGEKELRHIAGLILILGYRCGLRRHEVLKAQLDSPLLDPPAEFLVRPWSERKLKTPNAVRKLPLSALMDPCELELLQAWVERRRIQNSQSTPSPFLFFTTKLEGKTVVPDGMVFPLIHEELRRVTQDEGCHFHTARKSGAGTFLAFTLLRPHGVSLPGWLNTWPKQKARIEDSAQLHRKLYRNDFTTRRHLFAIARTLGHSSPGVSCANYLELQGDLLALWLDTERPILSVKQFRALTGKSAGTANNLGKELYNGLWKHIEHECRSVHVRCISFTGKRPSGAQATEDDVPLSVDQRFEKEEVSSRRTTGPA